MARVGRWAGPPGQLRLISGLRWRIFTNSLRTRRGKLDLASRAVVGVSLTAMAFGVGVILSVGAWAAFRSGQPFLLGAELWFIFAFWQALPVFVTGFGAQANLAHLLRFPVRFSAFAMLNLTYGVSDPVALAGIYWLLAVLVGVAAAAPAALGLAALAVIVLAAVNVALNRALLAWLERWLARRRSREILGVIFIFLVFSLQFVGPLSRRWGSRALPGLHVIVKVGEALPPGLAAGAIVSAVEHRSRVAGANLGALALEGVFFAWLLLLRLRAQFRGEELSEGRRAKAAGARQPVRPGWSIAGLSPTMSALVEKELRYLLRNTSVYLTVAVPVLLVLVFGLSGGKTLTRGLAIPGLGGVMFPAAVAYCLVILFGLAYNGFGYDGTGLTALFAAPLRFREVLAAKNLIQGAVVGAEVLAVYALNCLVFSRPEALVTVLTLLWTLFSLPANFAAADLASLYFPRKLVFGALRRQKAPAVALLIAFVVQIVVGIAGGAAYLLGRWTGNLWYTAAGILALVVIAWAVYWRVLEACDDIALRRREQLMAEFSRHAA